MLLIRLDPRRVTDKRYAYNLLPLPYRDRPHGSLDLGQPPVHVLYEPQCGRSFYGPWTKTQPHHSFHSSDC